VGTTFDHIQCINSDFIAEGMEPVVSVLLCM
jgi:hypothetical protein